MHKFITVDGNNYKYFYLILTSAKLLIMSLEDYNTIEETLYLLRSPKNAQRLKQAIGDLEAKKL